MIRLDKYIADAAGLTRSEAGKAIRSGAVVRIVQRAFPEAQAAAADTAVQIVERALELGHLHFDPLADGAADPCPILAGGGAPLGQLAQLLRDLRQGEAQLLGDQRKGDAADVRAQEPALIAARADRMDDPLPFIEAHGRHRDASTRRQFADRQEFVPAHFDFPA